MIQLILKGGWVMGPLLICSVVAVTFIIERFLFWKDINKKTDAVITSDILTAVANDTSDQAHKLAAHSFDPVNQVLAAALAHPDSKRQAAIDLAVSKLLNKNKQHMGILETLISVSPMLGILGTVIGIIVSFDVVSQSGIQDPKLVTEGIGQALITTATGLLIAISTTIPYNYFLSKIDQLNHRLETALSDLEIRL